MKTISKRLIICLTVIILGGLQAYTQGQANNWYFGYNAGLNFSGSQVRVLADGSLKTLEGCATISDENGNLLFYTDGITVYRADHSIMPNGSGLLGNPSSTQSAIIIPQPDTPGIFYIFTVDTATQEGEVNDGINFSVVDFNQDPKGKVIEKNVKLLNYGAEKLSAVIKSCTDNSVWVVMLSSFSGNAGFLDTFYAYDLSRNGLNRTPVTSSAGFTVDDPRGNLKFSPDGTKLAIANVSNGLFLADFNSLTGQISNSQRLAIYGPNIAPYGIEFSPNNRYLYSNSSNNEDTRKPPGDHFSTLIQYDTQAADIEASQVLLDQQGYFRGSLQLAPDGKIYRALSLAYEVGLPYLGVIERPNESGTASNYRDKAIYLGSGRSYQGLPPFNQSLFNELDIIQNEKSARELALCDGEHYMLQYEEVSGASYTWFKDDVLVPGANDFKLNISQPAGVSLPYTETYRFVLDLNDGSCDKVGVAEVTYYAYPQAVNNVKLVQCEDSDSADGLSVFNLHQADEVLTGGDSTLSVAYYPTYNQALYDYSPVEPVGYENKTPTETLYARVTNPSGCATVNAIDLEVSSTTAAAALLEACDVDDTGYANFNLSQADSQVLASNTRTLEVNYYLTELGALLEDADELLNKDYRLKTPYEQIVYARAENNNQCFAISAVTLRVNRRPDFRLPEDAYYCAADYPDLHTYIPDYSNIDTTRNYTYHWYPEGQTTPELMTNLTGEHTLRVTDIETGCFREETFTIIEKELAIIESIEVTDASENNTAVIEVTGNGNYELALDDSIGPYQDGGTFTGLQPGFHTVYVRSKEGCGIVEEEFSIIGFPKYFTPNGDGYHDYWNVKGISELVQPNTLVRVFNRYGKLIKELNPLSEGWDGTFAGENLPADDYWFRVLLEDGREFKSHFTLKR